MKLKITINLGSPGPQDGYDAYQLIAQSNIPHHRAGPASGEFVVAGESIGEWEVSE